MYNRYIPQPDGSFRRSRVPDRPHPTPPCPPPEAPCPPPQPEPCGPPPCPPPEPCSPPKDRPRQEHCRGQSRESSPGSFLRALLPKDFDTGDLLIILLLLLMAGDCQEDQNTALLTLALYLFM